MSRDSSIIRRIGAWLIPGIICVLLGAPAAGKDLRFAPNINPKGIVADHLINLARMSVQNIGGMPGAPRPDQLVRAEILLDLAQQLNSRDAETWRLRFELAKQTKDRVAQRAALQQYCLLRPDDDAAQLELIMSMLDQEQILTKRLARVEALLNSRKADQLTKALRSRLASFAARGAAEIGDQMRFQKRLSDALRLDPTNHQAARMAFDLVTTRNGTSVPAVTAALMHLIGAQPLDAELRLRFARLLFAHGLYEQADEQFRVAHIIESQILDQAVVSDWCMVMVATGELDDALEFILEAEQEMQTQLIGVAQRKMYLRKLDAEKEGKTFEDLPPELRQIQMPPPLSMPLQLLRLAIFYRADYKGKADAVYTQLTTRLKRLAEDDQLSAEADLVWLAAFFNRWNDDARAGRGKLAEAEKSDELLLGRIDGWTALHAGQFDKAQHILAPLADRDPLAAYGLAMSYRDTDDEKKIETLHIAAKAHGTLAGLLGALDLHEMDIEPQRADDDSIIAKTYEHWEDSARDPFHNKRSLLQFSITVINKDLQYLDPLLATVRIRNVGDMPLALGEQSGMPTSAFLIAGVHGTENAEMVDLPPVVLDLRRRLTLEPGQSVEVTVRLGSTPVGAILAQEPRRHFGVSLSAFLNPVPQPGERLQVGLMGGTDQEHYIDRKQVLLTDQAVRQWMNDMDGPDPVERLRATALLTNLVPQMISRITQLEQALEAAEQAEEMKDEEDEDGQEDKPQIDAEEMKNQVEQLKASRDIMLNTLTEKFSRLEPYEQAWITFFMDRDPVAVEVLRDLHQQVRKSDDPLVRIAYMAFHIMDDASPLIDADARHENAMISTFAEAHRAWISKRREQVIKLKQQQRRAQRRRALQ